METHINGKSHRVSLSFWWQIPDTHRISDLQGLPWPAGSWDLEDYLPPQCTHELTSKHTHKHTHRCALTCIHKHSYKWSPHTFFNTQLNYCPTCESFSGQYTTITEISTPSFVSSLYVLHNNYIATPIIIYYTHLFTSLSRFTKLWTHLR